MGEPRGQGAGPSGIAGTQRGPWGPAGVTLQHHPWAHPREVAFRLALQACASEALASLLAPSACPACPKSHPLVATVSDSGQRVAFALVQLLGSYLPGALSTALLPCGHEARAGQFTTDLGLLRATHRVRSKAGRPPLQWSPETPISLWVFLRDQWVVHRVFRLGSGCFRFLDP